jgi:hypothetical protein
MMGQHDQAIVEARKAIELDPNFFLIAGPHTGDVATHLDSDFFLPAGTDVIQMQFTECLPLTSQGGSHPEHAGVEQA